MSAKAGIESAGKCLPEAQQDLDVALPDKKSVSTLTMLASTGVVDSSLPLN